MWYEYRKISETLSWKRCQQRIENPREEPEFQALKDINTIRERRGVEPTKDIELINKPKQANRTEDERTDLTH